MDYSTSVMERRPNHNPIFVFHTLLPSTQFMLVFRMQNEYESI
jgi:hypothetical protein